MRRTDLVHGPRTTRRRVLRGMGSGIAVAATAGLVGCGDDASSTAGSSEGGSSTGGSTSSASTSASTSSTADGSSDGSSGIADASTSDASTSTADGSESTGTVECTKMDGWATGGTAAMCGNYPDPFAGGIGNACELTCSSTLGPCYAETIERRDISEGDPGLPVRLALKIVDVDCNPIVGAEVDVWHTNANGLYSGEDASTFCTLGDPAATASRWMRGVQITDRDGRVDFDTCFPGWYGGRTIHIHFQIRIGGFDHVTSQLFFDDALSDEIIGKQPIYSDRGARDTTNDDDGVIGGGDIDNVLLQAERMPDGAMLAWRAIVVRTNLADPACQI